MIARRDTSVQMVPIDRVTVVNARSRGQNKFKQIVGNIGRIGLKRPITVARRDGPGGDGGGSGDGDNGGEHYHLVCGQGRLEAMRALGATSVPAIVIEATHEELLIMSLIENLARRRKVTIELAREIASMKERGYDFADVARKTDLDVTYVRGIVRLLNKGEERLLRAVERGQIPLSIAVTIASSDDQAVQRALAEAYENKSLRGRALLKARRLIEERRTWGKAGGRGSGGVRGGASLAASGGHEESSSVDNGSLSSAKLLKTYHQEMNRQRLLVRKAKVCETRLLFIVSALKSVLQEEALVHLLRAEGLETMPQFLADQIAGRSTT